MPDKWDKYIIDEPSSNDIWDKYLTDNDQPDKPEETILERGLFNIEGTLKPEFGSAIKKEGWGALRHIPAAALDLIESATSNVPQFARKSRSLSEYTRGPQEGLTEAEKEKTMQAEQALQMLIPLKGLPPAKITPTRKIKSFIKTKPLKEEESISKSLYPEFPKTEVEQSLKNAISKSPEQSKFTIATDISNDIKAKSFKDRKPFEFYYEKAEPEFNKYSGIYRDLAHKNDEIINSLEEIAKRNPGEEKVLEYAKAIRDMVGTRDGYIETQAGKLVKQSNSLSEVAKYDMPFIGSKGIIRKMVRDLNEAAKDLVKEKGGNYELLEKADKLYGKWADKYLSEEIAPFITKTIATPEDLYESLIKNPGTYRAAKNIDSSIATKLNRDIVHNKLNKYLDKPELVGTEAYRQDLRDLHAIVGAEDVQKANKFLQQSSRKPRFNLLEMKKKLNSREGIREVKKELHRIQQDEFFDKIVVQHVEDLLKGGKVTGKKLKPKEMYNLITQRDNYEVFSEILGESKVQEMIEKAKIDKRNEVTKDIIKDVLMKATHQVTGGTIAGSVANLLLKFSFK